MTDVLDVPSPLGKPIKRTEDPRFITGEGRYLDDIKLAVDDPHGHPAQPVRPRQHPLGRHVARPRRCPASSAVFVGADIPYNPLPMAWPAGGSAGIQNNVNTPRDPRHGQRQVDRRGRRRGRRRDARRRPTTRSRRSTSTGSRCPPSSTPRRPSQPGAPQLHENAPNNVVFEWNVGDKAGTDAAIDGAEVVVRQRIVNQRLIPNPMETRGDIGWYNPGTDEYTIWMSSQTPHIQRLLLAAFVTGIPEHKIRCISPDVGGAFGTKIFCYADMALTHVRQQGASAAGRSSGSRAGARTTRARSTAATTSPTSRSPASATARSPACGSRRSPTSAAASRRSARASPRRSTPASSRGCYKIPNVYAEVTGVYTNTTFVDAYRGAGRPEATYVIERAMDLFAAEIGMDRAEVRRRNFIQPDQFPYENPSGLGTAIRRGQDLHRLRQLRAGDGQGPRDGRLRGPRGEEGRGQGPRQAPRAWASRTYIEVCGVAPSKWIGAVGEGWGAAMWESSNIKVHLTGKVVVTMGTQPQGQGHETTYAQVVADELGIPMEDIIIQHSDTQGTPFGYGSYGSRTSSVGHDRGDQGGRQDQGQGPAATRPTCSRPASTTSRSTAPSTGSRARPTARRRFQEIAFALDLAFDAPEGMEPYLDETAYYDTPNCTWPFGTHIAIVEIDEETGDVDLVRYVAVDDVGNKINPMIVDGQLHGGIAQGVGQALWEGADLQRRRPAPDRLDARLRAAEGRRGSRPSSSTRRSRRRRSTRSASRASARPARSPAPRPSPTPSSMR